MEQTSIPESAIVGSLLGTAVGDAIGLPYEGLSRRRAARMLGPPDSHRLLFGRGLISDDTEHTCLVAQSLITAEGSRRTFLRHLAWGFRLWILALPAGVGLATLRACVRLWLGVPATRSGVFSAGNGPAMRSAILGASIADRDELLELVRLSTRITHTDPKAEYGAIAVALAARDSRQTAGANPGEYISGLRACLPPEADELVGLLRRAVESADAGESTPAFATSMGLATGVSGYTYHTVPVAIHAWFSNPRNFRSAIIETISCGGDTDTVAAIVGGIVGSAVGRQGIPSEWLAGIRDWPRTVAWMEGLALSLHHAVIQGERVSVPRLWFVSILGRNLFFLVVVLGHGIRRLLPPY